MARKTQITTDRPAEIRLILRAARRDPLDVCTAVRPSTCREGTMNHYLKVAMIAIVAIAIAKRTPVLNQWV